MVGAFYSTRMMIISYSWYGVGALDVDLDDGDDGCDDDEDVDDAAVIGDLILILFVLNHCLAFSICPRALTKAQTDQLYMYLYFYLYLYFICIRVCICTCISIIVQPLSGLFYLSYARTKAQTDQYSRTEFFRFQYTTHVSYFNSVRVVCPWSDKTISQTQSQLVITKLPLSKYGKGNTNIVRAKVFFVGELFFRFPQYFDSGFVVFHYCPPNALLLANDLSPPHHQKGRET